MYDGQGAYLLREERTHETARLAHARVARLGRASNELRRRGALVRVTYQPVAERVLDVSYAEEPAEAVPLDGPKHT